MNYLFDKIGEAAMLEQTAEECSELAQACLKMARKIRGENPTPKSAKEIADNLAEEVADVFICLQELKDRSYDSDVAYDWIAKKADRIVERFEGGKS